MFQDNSHSTSNIRDQKKKKSFQKLISCLANVKTYLFAQKVIADRLAMVTGNQEEMYLISAH